MGARAGTFDADLARARDLHRAGRMVEAETLYAALAAEKPDEPDLLFLLGIVAHQRGDQSEAARLIERAIEGGEGRADFWRNLAVVRDAAGNRNGALAAARRAVTLDGTDAEAWSLLGALLLAADGDSAEAEAALTRALDRAPDHPEARSNLASIFIKRGRDAEAESILNSVLARQPSAAGALHNLAVLMWSQGEFERGLELTARALAARPGWGEALLLRGILRAALGDLDEGIAEFRRLIAARPDHAEAHWSLALTLLLKGEYAEGWREYEWRWRRGEMKALRRDFGTPQWDGAPLQGRTVFLYAEQGAGDTFQFARYIPLVKARGAGRIILQCNSAWTAMLRSVADIDAFVTPNETPASFDHHAALLSLPLIFGTTLDTIPAPNRYLAADPARVAAWAARLAHLPRPRVGLCWQGNPGFKADRRRSPPLAILAPFARAGRASFVSVHRGAGESQITGSGIADRLTVLSGMDDFADTAAVMEALDLIVTSDTSVAHLAGALGRPTWTLLGFAPDWRWLLGREDTPWYPTMRLFRQAAPGDWAGIARRLTDAFAKTFGP